MRWAAILAGGSGTRFWPVSTPERPKQFLPLGGDKPLLLESVMRLDPLIEADRVLVITGQAHAAQTRELLSQLPAENVLAEPKAAYTAPALAWATHEIQKRDPEATVLSLHADWFVGDNEAFRGTATRALQAAEEHDSLITVGIVPTRPEIGYGYIQPGRELGPDVRKVHRFLEKPDEARAATLIESGALWNSGMFAWTAERFFAETHAHAPELAGHLAQLDDDDVDGFFNSVTPIVIDISHFERSDRVAVIPGDFPWDDVGTWPALARIRPTDANHNCSFGEVVTVDAEGNVVWATEEPVVLAGVSGLVVVRAPGVTLVTTAERATHLKSIIEQLPEHIRNRS